MESWFAPGPIPVLTWQGVLRKTTRNLRQKSQQVTAELTCSVGYFSISSNCAFLVR